MVDIYNCIYNYIRSPRSTLKKEGMTTNDKRYDIILIIALILVFLITVMFLERNSLFNHGLYEMVDEISVRTRSIYYGLVVVVIIMVLIMNKIVVR